MSPPKPATLAEIRAAAAEEAARVAITRALEEHATPSEAARSLGVQLAHLRRAAERAGVPWPSRGVGRPRKAP
jgi:transcriptional regulator with GAF, ATPase, and Fis domain